MSPWLLSSSRAEAKAEEQAGLYASMEWDEGGGASQEGEVVQEGKR